MAIFRQLRFLNVAVLVSLLAINVGSADELVINGDFELDTELFVTWPGYVGAGDNPPEVPEWFGNGGRGVNPIVDTAGESNPTEIPFWPGESNRGVNPISSPHDTPAPFADNGDNDTAIAFLQGAASINQDISGLSAGQNYILSFDFNSRDCCGDFPLPGLSLNGSVVDSFPDEDLLFGGGLEPVEPAGNFFEEWFHAEIPFAADSSDLNIRFFTESANGGDSTFILDNVSLIQEGAAENLVVNGDFETDAEDFAVWPGYTGTGVGGGQDPAPFRDNGNNDTAVAFMQGDASLEQEITGLQAGQEYTISLDFNARNCCGGAIPIAELFLDDEFIEDFPGDDFEDGIVEPVGDGNDWYHYEGTFVAGSENMFLRIATRPAEGGDSTLAIDNVSIQSMSSTPGDYNQNGVLDVEDIDLLTGAVRSGDNPAGFDLNSDTLVTDEDRRIWVEDLRFTYFGDANLDGEFNSADLVRVFQQGGYEDLEADNSTWGDGDWNGDGEFNSSDFVIAFQGGGFEQGPRAAVNSVPEPSTCLTLIGCLLGLAIRRRA